MFNFQRRLKPIAIHIMHGILATGFVIACVVLPTSVAMSRSHISTGQDLYDACKVLNEFSLNRQGRIPDQGLYCRQFISGYFTALKFAKPGSDENFVNGTPDYTNDCGRPNDPKHYDQLAVRIVRLGEWQPELMSRPAVELAVKAFETVPPCF